MREIQNTTMNKKSCVVVVLKGRFLGQLKNCIEKVFFFKRKEKQMNIKVTAHNSTRINLKYDDFGSAVHLTEITQQIIKKN